MSPASAEQQHAPVAPRGQAVIEPLALRAGQHGDKAARCPRQWLEQAKLAQKANLLGGSSQFQVLGVPCTEGAYRELAGLTVEQQQLILHIARLLESGHVQSGEEEVFSARVPLNLVHATAAVRISSLLSA
jgi:hypothetical protein